MNVFAGEMRLVANAQDLRDVCRLYLTKEKLTATEIYLFVHYIYSEITERWVTGARRWSGRKVGSDR